MKVLDLELRKRGIDNLMLVRSTKEYEIARELIEEYAVSLNFSLEFQDIDYELDHVREYYGPPTGVIVLANNDDEFVGCTCVRNQGDFLAEIKRMYVKPSHRCKGIGRLMLNKAIDEAKRLGFQFLRLDTVPEMESAIHLYLSCGFYEIEDYQYNPIQGARFMEYKL